MNPHWGLQRTEEPIDSTSESSPSEEESLFLDLDIDVQTQEEQDNTLDLSHQLLASLTLPRAPTSPSSTPIATQPIFPLLPPPPLIPPLATMTTTAKPIKLQIGIPEAYDGSFETLRQWLNAVQLYLLVNEDIYNNDDKKIAFVLSYITKGSALTWAATFQENSIDATGTITLGTYSNFVAKFKTSSKGTSLELLLPGSPPNKWSSRRTEHIPPLDQYVSEFKNHVTQANIKDPNILIGYFSARIFPFLMGRIMSTDTISTTIQEWYSKAIHFQTQWE